MKVFLLILSFIVSSALQAKTCTVRWTHDGKDEQQLLIKKPYLVFDVKYKDQSKDGVRTNKREFVFIIPNNETCDVCSDVFVRSRRTDTTPNKTSEWVGYDCTLPPPVICK